MPERAPPSSATSGYRAPAIACAIILGLCWAASRAQNVPAGQDYEQIARGRYLVVLSDCAACHTATPGQPFAGGVSVETPFGNVVAPNITPEPETGIGNWSDAQFDAAVRRGIRPNGQRLYPAMPYLYYARLTPSDVLAIRAYLNTVRPVRNAVIADQLPFPFNVRASMQVWDALYFDAGAFKPDPRRSAEWNRGAYLVEGAGHCGACHTPKTTLGGDKYREFLQGYNLQRWFAPNITNDAETGIGRWSVDDLVAYLKTGHNKYSAATGPMGDEIGDSSSQWREEDLRAVAVYLKSQGAPGHETTSTAQVATAASGAPTTRQALARNDPRMVAGAGIYADLCSACHAPNGRGVAYLFPDLTGSPNVAQRDPTTLIRVILQGAQSVATQEEPTAPAMPTFAWQLSDEQVAAVATYLRNSFGHAAPVVSAADVHAAREQLRPGVSP